MRTYLLKTSIATNIHAFILNRQTQSQGIDLRILQCL